MLSYVMIGANDIPRAEKFYSAFLPKLGYVMKADQGCLIYSLPGTPDFYVKPPYDGQPASVGNGTMIAFQAQTHRDVRELHGAALAAGGQNEGKPGFRDEYSERFYVSYLRDPQGNKIALFCNNPKEPKRPS